MAGPLAALKIVDFSTLLPGPFASMMLADMGADVLRVEAPHRPDMTRFIPPFDGDVSAWHAVLNRSKRSLGLDLKQSGAAEIVKRLVSPEVGYDIVLEQFRPGVMDRLGIGYEALRAVNPRLIYCAITGYGQTGPFRNRAGHDNNYLALAGVMSHSRRPRAAPVPQGVQIADVGGGSLGAITGILAAVIERSVSGQGQMVDISMFDMAVAWQATAINQYTVGEIVPGPESWHLNGGGFYDYYQTQDGRFLSVGSLEPKFWSGFCQAIGRPDLVNLGMSPDPADQQMVKAEIQRVIGQRPLATWADLFARLDVCVEPVLTIPEMMQHPQTQARQLIVEVPKPNGRCQRQVASPYKFSRSQPEYTAIGAPLGAHSQIVLAEIGYTAAEIAAFQATEVLG